MILIKKKMEKLFYQVYDVFLDSEWRGEYKSEYKPRIRRLLLRNRLLRRNNITYKTFIKYCKYSRKDFRKFLIIANDLGICKKSFELLKKSYRMIIKKKYPKHVKKIHVKRSYPIILYALGYNFEYFKKDQEKFMFECFKKSGRLGFKKSIVGLERRLLDIEIIYKERDEEKFYKCLKFICDI